MNALRFAACALATLSLVCLCGCGKKDTANTAPPPGAQTAPPPPEVQAQIDASRQADAARHAAQAASRK